MWLVRDDYVLVVQLAKLCAVAQLTSTFLSFALTNLLSPVLLTSLTIAYRVQSFPCLPPSFLVAFISLAFPFTP